MAGGVGKFSHLDNWCLVLLQFSMFSFIHEPWSMLPFNAFMNASATLCLFLLLISFTGNRRISLLLSLPFILFPSALKWNTQFHNEIFSIPGMFFILFGFVIMSKEYKKPLSQKIINVIISILLIAIGSILSILVRDYIFSGILYLCVIAGCGLGIHWLIQKIQQRLNIREFYVQITLLMFTLFIMLLISFAFKPSARLTKFVSLNAESDSLKMPSEEKWEASTWLPSSIDHQLGNLAQFRNRIVKPWADGGSSIDLDITFESAGEMFAYIPRSLQIAFLSPFPNIWFSAGKKVAGSAMRIVSAFEMLIAYFCLLGLPLFLWTNRRLPEVWLFVFICTSMLIVYAMIIPNQGALYRFRYPFYMPLICLGLAGLLSKFSKTSLLSPIKK